MSGLGFRVPFSMEVEEERMCRDLTRVSPPPD